MTVEFPTTKNNFIIQQCLGCVTHLLDVTHRRRFCVHKHYD
jgi:hypothetical protein